MQPNQFNSSPADSYKNFWNYLSQNQKDLLLEGNYLMNEIIGKSEFRFKDYSFLVFPYAKAYEGYLKEVFKDIGYISRLDYISDHLRLGKLMSPNLLGRLGDRSLYRKMRDNGSKEFADQVWNTWKTGRNQVFHYFPHNIKALSFEEAQDRVNNIIQTMEAIFTQLHPQNRSNGEGTHERASV